MNVTVRIPTQLRALTQGEGEVGAPAGTLAEVIADLDRRYPGIAQRVLADGSVRRFVNLYVDGEDARFLSGLDTPVPTGAAVAIIPAVAGG